MQAMQSSTALTSVGRSNRFAALCRIHGEQSRLSSTEVAESAGLAHDAGNLLGALSLYSELLARPGVLHEKHREFASELRLLRDRSWAMIDRLVNHARIEATESPRVETTVLPQVVERCRGVLSRVAGRRVEASYGCGVRDTGCGMSSAAVRRLMQTGGISTAGGRGMGFRVVRELGAISGGCLGVESQPGVGTHVWVEWECGDGIDDLPVK